MTRRSSTRFDLDQRRIVYALVSTLLRYPDQALQADLPGFRDAVAQLPDSVAEPLERMVQYLDDVELLTLQRAYVDLFDLRRRCCLYLSYYLNGDTRRRGQALWEFQDSYRRAGFCVEARELPDFLPAVLELGAVGDESVALELLQPHRGGLRLLRDALSEAESPYVDAIVALDAALPPPKPGVIANAFLLRQYGPPTELVGVEPHDGMGPFEPGGSAGALDVETMGGSRR